MKKCCNMKGFLSFIVLHMISDREMSGEDIRLEIEKRRGSKPSPGTIYPVLKKLHSNGWITEHSGKSAKEKKYRLTKEGKEELRSATKQFVNLFCDMKSEFQK